MSRRVTPFLMAVAFILIGAWDAQASSTPSKAYLFEDLIFDSEAKRPSAQRFDVKDRARFGRLSYIAPADFIDDLIQTSLEPVLHAAPPLPKTPSPYLASLTSLSPSTLPCTQRRLRAAFLAGFTAPIETQPLPIEMIAGRWRVDADTAPPALNDNPTIRLAMLD